MEHVLCEICNRDDAQPYKAENGHQAVQCRHCGLVYCNPRPGIEQMKQLYDGQETKVDVRAHLRERDRKTIQARACLRILERHRRGGRLLEVGSAAGYFLHEARQRGFEVQGLDLTRRFVEFSQRVLDVPAFEGTLRAAPFAAQSFDVVYLRNVISHLAYPRQELQTLAQLLRPGGHLMLETGNVAELTPEVAGELELPDHLYHFSEANLRVLLADAGVQCVSTHRYALLGELPSVRRARALLSRGKPERERAAPAPVTDEELRLPPSRLSRRLAAHLAVLGRYQLGRVLPKQGRRCTLVMIGRRAA
jgi:2-polyprenyl-3-methyl-5-hydroxy-6-metoxy-1,4-benzoquinol methylase